MCKETLEQKERAKGIKAPFEYEEIPLSEVEPFSFGKDAYNVISLNGVYEMAEGGEALLSF